MARIMWCRRCKRYTLKERCPICGERTIWKVPPKFSPEDRWGKYRREVKRRMMENADKEGRSEEN